MVSGFISRIVILVFGTLYPAYASYKAVRTKNVKEYVKWMMYWIVFALFTCAETFTDLFLGFWFPFYYEIKIITVVYLLSPATKGSSILYRKFVHPVLIKREQEIDEYIAKMKEQGYHTMLNLGSKGVNYATSFIMQTAIKSGGGLVNQLRKSYSLNDLSGEQDVRKVGGDSADSADYIEDPRLIRRNVGSIQSPARQTGLYFPEADISQRPDGDDYRHIPSYEKTGSGYPSGEPYYYGLQQPVGPHLTRTASLGPSSRIRTRASTKQGLPKRSTLSEEGSTRASMELHESQNESENVYNFPLSHSASFPFVFHPFQHLVLPEYQHMFGNLTQNQMFTFINHTQSPQFLNNVRFGNSDGVFESITGGDSVVISEEKSDDQEIQRAEKNKLLQSDVAETNDIVNTGEKNVEIPADGKNKNLDSGDKRDLESENSEKVPHLTEPAEVKDKPVQERSGKYNKKPAPIPPVEEPNSKTTDSAADEEDAGFFTPNASPKFTRKNSNDLSTEKISVGSNYLEVPKKSKTKAKKTDFIPKKLHMPKMTFSLFHSKGSKQASGSETSSVASVEIPSENAEGKNELEYFIPLRDEESTSERITEKVEDKHDL